jgi:hypothetical protein
MATPFEIPEWAKSRRPANVAATGSDAPPTYAPIPTTPPGSVYTHRGHAAQYGRGRRNGRTIRAIILHTTESDSWSGGMTYDAWRPETVSAHCHLGGAGEIGYGVPEADRSWTTGRWNDEALNVEITGRAAWTVDQWRARPKQIAALADLLEDWCRRHSIPAVWLTAAQFAEGASRQGYTPVAGTRRGIVDHLEANRAAILLGGSASTYSHHDIGPGLRWIVLGEVIPEVARRLGAPTGPTLPPLPPDLPHPGGTMSDTFTFERPPRRLLDTRSGLGARPVNAETSIETGAAGAIGALVTVTVTQPSAPGFLTAWAGGPRPNVSCLNFTEGQTVANTTAVELDAAGRFVLGNYGAHAHLVVDLVGLFR